MLHTQHGEWLRLDEDVTSQIKDAQSSEDDHVERAIGSDRAGSVTSRARAVEVAKREALDLGVISSRGTSNGDVAPRGRALCSSGSRLAATDQRRLTGG